ncbi:replicative DNA helicase [Methylobacterium sp. J-030]|uniref:replicative DNA helicase n=1 Tax=Methylobacterium sp. J-030 TaxID=2836627 RepID=UPI001FBA3EC1|nr:replicative DNA helicase [Methylobacterium sp. J-030]MCJ2069704.1 replicative DNA helicase [Methylobacterium sp. J-030]
MTNVTAARRPLPVAPTAEPVTPPRAIEAEQSLLGAILRNAEALDRARDHVCAEDFFDDVHRQVFTVMCQRRDAGEHIDWRLLTAVLSDADLGGVPVSRYLGNLAADAITVVGAPGYARIIAEAARMRTVLATAQAAVVRMSEGSVHDPAPYAAFMIDALDGVVSAGLAEHARRVTLKDGTAGVLARIERARQGLEPQGVPYGLPRLDRDTLGMRPGQFIVLAGRPGMGKTTVALHVALNAARRSGPVGFFSLEMGADELSERMLAATAYDPREREPITYRAIAEARHLSPYALDRLREAERVCADVPLWIEQEAGLTLGQIAARARQMRVRAESQGTPLSALVVDHIGLIKPSQRYLGNRVQEMTEISAGLKGLAKELGIPVLGLSQLNREAEKRPDKRPQLADLRESGSIEQDADVVLGLFREAYYLEHKADRTDAEEARLFVAQDELEIEILKQRSGPTGRIVCFCDVACNVLAEKSR